jgi:hypothetical protein
MNFPRPTSPSLLRRPASNGGSDHADNGQRTSNGPQHRVRFPDNLGSSGGGGSGGSSNNRSSGRTRSGGNVGGGNNKKNGVGPVQILADCLTASVALVCIAGVSTLMAVLHVVVRPFSVTVYRRLASQLGAASFVDSMSLLLPNTRIYLTGDSDLPTPVGTSLLVSNHLVDGDWWAVFLLGRCIGLRGSIKVFMRNEYLNVCLPTDSANSSSNSSSGGGGGAASSSGTSNGGGNTASSSGAITSAGPSFGASKNSASNVKPPPPSSGNGPAPSFSNGNGGPPAHPTVHSHSHSHGTGSGGHYHPQDLSILAKLLHLFLEFPLINGEDYSSNREQLFQLLRSFAEHDGAAAAPTHLLFFPEGWSLHNGANRASVLKISNDFAQREGRPQLKHLLLPRARGFNSSLECLRESSPVVYDITMVRDLLGAAVTDIECSACPFSY